MDLDTKFVAKIKIKRESPTRGRSAFVMRMRFRQRIVTRQEKYKAGIFLSCGNTYPQFLRREPLCT